MNYRGIIIEESLVDRSIIEDRPIISKTTVNPDSENPWHMDKIELPEIDLDTFTKLISEMLKTDQGWYVHFYHEDPKNDALIVVFPNKIIKTKKTSYKEAIDYGLNLGIPRNQMEIKPTEIANEEW